MNKKHFSKMLAVLFMMILSSCAIAKSGEQPTQILSNTSMITATEEPVEVQPSSTPVPTATPVPQPTPTATLQAVTEISIDGQCNEWANDTSYDMQLVGSGGQNIKVFALENNDSLYVCVQGVPGFLGLNLTVGNTSTSKNLAWSFEHGSFTRAGTDYSETVTELAVEYPESELMEADGGVEFRIRLKDLVPDQTSFSGVQVKRMEIAVAETEPGVVNKIYFYSNHKPVTFKDEFDTLSYPSLVSSEKTSVSVDGSCDDWEDGLTLPLDDGEGTESFMAFANYDSFYLCAPDLEKHSDMLQVEIDLVSRGNDVSFEWLWYLYNDAFVIDKNGRQYMIDSELEFKDDLELRISLKEIDAAPYEISVQRVVLNEYSPVTSNLYWSREFQFNDSPVVDKEENDDPDLVEQKRSRYINERFVDKSSIARFMELPPEYDVYMIDEPRYRGPAHIAQGGDDGFYLSQPDLPEVKINYIGFDGSEKCSVVIPKTELWTAFGLAEGPDDTAFITVDNTLYQIDKQCKAVALFSKPYPYTVWPVGYSEKLGLISKGVNWDSLWRIPDPLGGNTQRELIADGFDSIEKVLVTLDDRLLVWDWGAGKLYLVDPETGSKKVVYRPVDQLGRSWHQNAFLANDPDSPNEVYVTSLAFFVKLNLETLKVTDLSEVTANCYFGHPDLITAPDNKLIMVDGMFGGLYKVDLEHKRTDNFINYPTDTSDGIDMGPDGTVYMAVPTCDRGSVVWVYKPDGTKVIFDGFPKIITNLKYHLGKLYVLATENRPDPGMVYILDPESGDIIDTIDLPSSDQFHGPNGMAVLNNGNILSCEHLGSNTCYEFGVDGYQKVHYFNINSTKWIGLTDQTSDGYVYATTTHERSGPSNRSGVYLKELDIENGTTRILLDFNFLINGWEADILSIAKYGAIASKDVGLFLTSPNPIAGIYHLTPQGLQYLREGFDNNSYPELADVLNKVVDDKLILFRIATNIPQDTFKLAAGINEEGNPYIVQSSNWGPLLFYEKP